MPGRSGLVAQDHHHRGRRLVLQAVGQRAPPLSSLPLNTVGFVLGSGLMPSSM
jgi:hypothetical protein